MSEPCPRCGQPHPGCTAHNRAGRPCGQACAQNLDGKDRRV